MNYERIVQSAYVMAEFWEAETMSVAEEKRFESALAQVTDRDEQSVRLAAVKLLLERSYAVYSDNPARLEQYRGLAKFMGASVIENITEPTLAYPGLLLKPAKAAVT